MAAEQIKVDLQAYPTVAEARKYGPLCPFVERACSAVCCGSSGHTDKGWYLAAHTCKTACWLTSHGLLAFCMLSIARTTGAICCHLKVVREKPTWD